ncbi:uncharacterized protein [Euwallacea similis]|uniref:uncharacterized protein n=1 Tax=Euwallacea similis TaxID=1736056 RepID=UPI00344BC5D5
MKRTRNEPRLLPNVIEAIANMKERAGSTQKQITGHISQWLANTDTSSNVAMKVRKALEYGLQSGLIKQTRGKYSLGLNKRDYATCRGLTDPCSDCTPCRGRGRRGKRSGRRRRSRSRRRRSKRRSRYPTRRHMSTEDDVIENIESNMSMMDTVEPMDKSRRRRSKKRRNKRRRKRYSKIRRRSTLDGVNSDTSDVDHKELKEEERRLEEEKPGNELTHQPVTSIS